MFLTAKEEGALAGERGRPLQWAMETLVRCKEAKTSSELIQVDRVHLPSDVLPILGSMEDLLQEGARVMVPTSVNPTRACGRPQSNDAEPYQDRAHAREGKLAALGVLPIHTCTPFLTGMVPKRTDRVVCGSATVSCYLNSIVGCHSAHVGADVALASSLVGLAPSSLFDLGHGRVPEVVVSFDLEHQVDPSLLGGFLNMLMEGRAPLITGVRMDLSGAKALAGALAVGGTRSFFLDGAFDSDDEPRERMVVDEKTLRSWREAMPREDDPDAICIGCPHLSEKELLRLANAMDGRRSHEGPDVFFLTSQLAWDKSPRPALVLQKIGAACCDSCPRLGISAGHKRIVTNGTRLCDCMAGTGPKASFAPLDEIITMLQG